MKKLLCILFSVALLLGLCACVSSPEETSDMPENGNADHAMGPESGNTEDVAPTKQNQFLLKDCLRSITDISDMRQDGSYLLYGADYDGMPCYGIWYPNGTFTILDDYATYFALANGCFLVSNDAATSTELRATSKNACAVNNGKIINRVGQVLFEAEENQKLHIINSTALLLVEVISGFDGKSLRYGVIDNNGNWIYEMGTDELFSAYLTDYINFESQNEWQYQKKLSISRCPNYGDSEGKSVFFKDDNYEYHPLVYDLSTNTFFMPENAWYSFAQVSDTEWICMGSSMTTDWGNYINYSVFDISGQRVGSIGNYVTTIDGVKYWYKINISQPQELTIANDNNPDGYIVLTEYTQRHNRVLQLEEDRVHLCVTGADGLKYYVVHDSNGDRIGEPLAISAGTLLSDDLVVGYNSEDSKCYILNVSTRTEVSCVVEMDRYIYDTTILDMGSGLFGIRFYLGDGAYSTYIVTSDGEKLF